jgi:outer membrane protein assembly factor BamE (lipoprotein component of BamABCDE complex)
MSRFVFGLLVLGSLALAGCNSEYRDLMETREYDKQGNFTGHKESRWMREKITREPVERERVVREDR